MNSLEEYIAQLKEIFASLGLDAIEEKKINYGVSLRLIRGQEEALLNVFNGKKGINPTWTGKENALRQEAEALLGESAGTSLPGMLLRDEKGFDGLWAGSDESGKGDFFGPLVVAAVALNEEQGKKLAALGVKDCKVLTDKKIQTLAEKIPSLVENSVVLTMKPEFYNIRYEEVRKAGGSLNSLLSNGHAVALTKALAKVPNCKFCLVDEFARRNDIAVKIHQHYPAVKVFQRPRAEEDIAVAAASVLARAKFLEVMNCLSTAAGTELPLGAGSIVDSIAANIVREKGLAALDFLVKKHFKNFQKILNGSGE